MADSRRKPVVVVAVASSALFDLRESAAVFRGSATAYRRFQHRHEDEPLRPGVAFPFVQRLLRLNSAMPGHPVEVILLSRNDPDTGLRVFNSIEAHRLGITRAAFRSGRYPREFIEAFGAHLFLSEDEKDVRDAMNRRYPAGRVLRSLRDGSEERTKPLRAAPIMDDEDDELRVAFDFDGVVADDSSERLFRGHRDVRKFNRHESKLALDALGTGPLYPLLGRLAALQRRERRAQAKKGYRPRLRIAIITARDAPAHKRVVRSLRKWGIMVDEAFFLGGWPKWRILKAFRPHIFFDDQLRTVRSAAGFVPSVHVPFGIGNEKDVRSAVNAQKRGEGPRASADRRAAAGLQGRYVALVRVLKSRQKAQVRTLRAAKGVRAAVKLAARLVRR